MPLRKAVWFPKLEACRLVVNVYKHGKGVSLDQLAARYPSYLQSPLDNIFPPVYTDPDYQSLIVTAAQFQEFDDALAAFWREFPERLFLPIDKLLAIK